MCTVEISSEPTCDCHVSFRLLTTSTRGGSTSRNCVTLPVDLFQPPIHALPLTYSPTVVTMSVHKAALVRYVSDLPPPFRTLPDALRSSSSPQALLAYSDDARHLPLAATLALIPAVYVLGLVSGNVSWVDRIWTSWPVLCSGSVLAWVVVNEGGNAYGACIPRLVVVLCLQVSLSSRYCGLLS